MAAVGTGTACTLAAVKANMEAGGSATITSLQGAVTAHNANTGGLNATYGVDPVTSLAEFQGYDYPSGVAVILYKMSIPAENYLVACGLLAKGTYYKTGVSNAASHGDVFYTDAGGTTIYNGGASWHRAGLEDLAFIISSLGVVSNVTICK